MTIHYTTGLQDYALHYRTTGLYTTLQDYRTIHYTTGLQYYTLHYRTTGLYTTLRDYRTIHYTTGLQDYTHLCIVASPLSTTRVRGYKNLVL